ncbi:unnamed protein product [Oreochromis niloticus]|nr:unnamed protein product [Mustela putorius furo]
MFGLKVTGNPEATVGLVAVDKGVYVLNNKHRLTQKKLWDIVEKSDTGCTPGGGKDSMGVFFDAGLLFETSAGSGTAYRQELKCHTVNRKKRNAAIMDVRSSLLKNYTDPIESECCLDGMKETPLSYTCEACSHNIVNCQGCRDAFLRCCKAEKREEDLKLVHRICVGDPFEVIVKKDFFIDLRLPYSAVRGEQIEIKAILHNYSPDRITVRIDLTEEEHLCSSASKRGRYRQEVTVGPETTRSVPFVIIPMKEGERRIEVKAAVKDSYLNDGVMKMLWVVMLPGGIHKAVVYLENRLPSLTNPYAVALTSYALANENKLNKEILYKFVSPEQSHWPVHKGSVYTLEATAYALLALVKTQNFEDARPVVRWFSQQQKVDGGYGSTQATIMIYQAVAEYWLHAHEPQYDLNVDIQLSGMPSPNKYYFNRDTYYATKTFKVNDINQNVTVTARGTGEATVTLVSRYYAKPKEHKSDCQDFTLSVELIPEETNTNDTYRLRIEVMYKNRDRDASMSILDIGLPFGFAVETRDLDLLSTGRGRTISKYEIYKALSERGSLIIYLDKVSHTQPEEIAFRIKQKKGVGVLQPTAVTVYEYSEQTRCVKYYNAQMEAGKLQHFSYTCLTAYKVLMAEFTEEVSTDSRKVQVLDTIKAGEYSPFLKFQFNLFQ